jgi:hypothetical protein
MLDDQKTPTSERAEQQQGLSETTEDASKRVRELMNETLFVTPLASESLERALQNQRNGVGRYSMDDLSGGKASSKEATIALNQAAAALLTGMDNMAASKSSSGLKEAMEQLQSLAGDQQKLNEQTQGMCPSGMPGPNGRPSPNPGNMLEQMAAQQEAIRQGLQDAMQKMGEGGGTLGKLSNTSEDMKQVVQDLKNGRIEQQTLDRQQRILSRLLDAPRSIEKRDYSRKRTSRPGVDVVRSSPGALSPELLKSRPSLAALLARGGRDPISPRYRAIVDEYFQAVLGGGGKR